MNNRFKAGSVNINRNQDERQWFCTISILVLIKFDIFFKSILRVYKYFSQTLNIAYKNGEKIMTNKQILSILTLSYRSMLNTVLAIVIINSQQCRFHYLIDCVWSPDGEIAALYKYREFKSERKKNACRTNNSDYSQNLFKKNKL